MEQLQVVTEIKVSYLPKRKNKVFASNAQAAFDYLVPFYPLETIQLKEYFVVLYLSNNNQVIGAYRLSEGGLTATIADIRLILGVALKVAATKIILSHNHPSGELSPSDADILLTKSLRDGCYLLNITLIDHIILGSPVTYFSFAKEEIAVLYE